MTKRKYASRYPLASFGPELMEVLLKGARERVEIPFPDHRTMAFFQMRIQMLRGAMARESHPQYSLAARARTARTWDFASKDKNKNCVLVIQPNDFQFRDILAGIGITPSSHTQDLLSDETRPPPTPPDPTVEPSTEPLSDNPYERFK
jgi:hypothetical protein